MQGAPLIGKDRTITKSLRSVDGPEGVVSAVSNGSIVHEDVLVKRGSTSDGPQFGDQM